MSSTVCRATSSIVANVARASGSSWARRRPSPACTRITLIACPAESWRSRPMRVRSSAAARRRSRSASRSARSARCSSSAIRSRRSRARSPASHAPPQTTIPNAIGVPGKPSSWSPIAVTCATRSTAASVSVRRTCAREPSPPAARKYSATVAPSGGPAGSATKRSRTLATPVTTNTPSGQSRRAISGSEVSATSTTAVAPAAPSCPESSPAASSTSDRAKTAVASAASPRRSESDNHRPGCDAAATRSERTAGRRRRNHPAGGCWRPSREGPKDPSEARFRDPARRLAWPT